MSILFITLATVILAIGLAMQNDSTVLATIPITLIGIYWLLRERLPKDDK